MASPEKRESSSADVERAQKGDREGFADLYERLAPSLYAWAAIRIHPRHRGRLDPADIVQDVWWRAMDRFSRFDPAQGSFRGWLFTIATNALIILELRLYHVANALYFIPHLVHDSF